MAQIALPRHQATQSQSAGVGSPLYQRRQRSNAEPIELLPNPDFSFPMRPSDTAVSAPIPINARPMSLQVAPGGRRGSMPHNRQKSVSALPAFSFNPAGPSKPDAESSPPHSPVLPTTPVKPAHGHRRGGSEFIGGDVRPGGTAPMSSSPTKGNDVLPAPSSTLRPGPPAGRSRHAHRRSGAVSSHDLSSMMNPTNSSRSGSAPSTPSEANQFPVGHSFSRSTSQPSLRSTSVDEDTSARPPSRARVGFSDRVEYIRPLSTISSETETSMSTFRGHSATNSLSSIVGGSSPQAPRPNRPMLSTVEDEGRPSTAGAVLDIFTSSPLAGDYSERKRPMSAISPISPTAPVTRVPAKRRGFFRLDSRRSDNTLNMLPTSISDPALSRSIESPLPTPTEIEAASGDSEKAMSTLRKVGRKPRKVKSWANAIMPRKGKQSKKLKARASTPPTGLVSDGEDTDASDDFEPNFDEDTTVTIVSPTESTSPELKLDTSYASWQPRQLTRVDSDIMSPVIDLDAALGPFQTPDRNSPRTTQRGFSAHRRAMHSSSALAPSHRRTESAPELVPFEFRPSATTTPAPMADVFEEEEPEEEHVLPSKDSNPASIAEEADEPQISLVEAEGKHEGAAINWNFDDGLGINRHVEQMPAASPEPLSPRTVPQYVFNEVHMQHSPELNPIEVVEDHEEPRTSSLTHSSDSTITPQQTTNDSKQHSPVMNLSIPLPQESLMTPDTFTSSFSSPDYRSSQASFETPRVGTAASSVTDYPAMPSPRFGEPGPELRVSVDDVPSLTSSRSTMTSAMHNTFPLPSPRKLGDRTASLSSDPSDMESRRRKRSSIASLSRLINSSSHGERSKLSIEQRPQSEHSEPMLQKKKSNRLSKLKFWRSSKDTSTSRT